jgi:hypothetical protein
MKRPISQDTSLEAEEVMLDIYRRMSPRRKLELVDDAIKTGRALSMTGLRSRHPKESRERLRRRLLGLVLGEALAMQVYGPLEDIP